MHHHPYSSVTGQLFTACRYAVYAILALLISLTWTETRLLAVAIAGYLTLACVMHAVCRPRTAATYVHVAHGLEAVLALTLLVWIRAPLEIHLLAASVFVSANTALWGWRGCLSQALGAGLVAGIALAALPSPSSEAVRFACLGAALVFSLGLSLAAHQQAVRLSRRGCAWRDESRALRRYLPEDLPRRLEDTSVHRAWYCVGFVDLSGFTRATLELDDRALELFLNNFLAAATSLVRAWDGHVAKFLGDGVLCVFPAETAFEQRNTAVQAVRCLRQMPEALQTGRTPVLPDLGASIGIACGECLAGEWGGAGRYDYTVIGAPVNRAQRLQARAARHGGLLMDARTAALIAPDEKPGLKLDLKLKGLGLVEAYPLSG